MKRLLFGSTVGVVIIALAVGLLVMLGYVYLGHKSPGQQVHVAYSVCTQEMIDQYNNISATSPDDEHKILKGIAEHVKATPHNEGDPTCQTMLFLIAFRTEDYQGMRQPMQLVQSMHDRGIYADSNLSSGYSVRAMSALLKEVISDSKSS